MVISTGGTRHGKSSRYPKSSQQQTGTGESRPHSARPDQDGTDVEQRASHPEGRLDSSDGQQRWWRQLRTRKESATGAGFRGPDAHPTAVAGASAIRPGITVRRASPEVSQQRDQSGNPSSV